MAYILHPETGIGDLKLKVKDLERSIGFYRDVVGLKLLGQENGTARLGVDGNPDPLLILELLPDAVLLPRRKSTTGLYHFAILVPSRKHLGLTLRHLIGSGVQIGHGDHTVSEALYFADPEGNGIEIYRDRPRDSWKKDADGNYVMATDAVDLDGVLAEAEGAEWTGLPAGTKIGHIHLHVGDLGKAREFYLRTLGFEPVADYANFSALFMSAGGYHHHIGTNIWAGAGAPQPPANAVGLDYFTVLLPDRETLGELIGHLREAGVSLQEQGDKAWFVQDPWNIRIRLAAREL